jgi:uncharacterized Tic20 family protein
MTSKQARLWQRRRVGPGPVPPDPGLPEVTGLPGVTEAEAKSATFGYLGAIFTGPVIPLVMYAIGRRRSPFRRFHAATALNLSLTGLLYGVCCLILCGMLLLDSRTAALVVVIPIAAGIWLSVLRYLIRGIGAAKRRTEYDIPAWICAKIAS